MKNSKILVVFTMIVLAVVLSLALTACEPGKTIKTISLTGFTAEFKKGTEFATGNITIEAKFSDESTEKINISECTVDSSAYNKEVVGKYDIVVTYEGKSYTYQVSVVEDELPEVPVKHTLNSDNKSYSVSRGNAYDTNIIIDETHNGLPVTSISDNAFEGRFALAKITFGENSQLTSIGEYAFSGCRGLSSITIPSGVKTIGEFAFSGCRGLSSITIPSGVTSIGDNAFEGCSGLKRIIFGENSQLTRIGDSTFGGCSRLPSITIPNGVISIGEYAFGGCSELSDVTFPSYVISIGKEAFSGCAKLTSVTIPSNVISIGKEAFSGCVKLSDVTIPSSVIRIGEYAFDRCSELTAVYITDLAKWCNISFDGYYSNPLIYAKNLYINEILATDITIPSSVTSINEYAFYGCSGLTSVAMPSSVTSIGKKAFELCKGLKSITISSSITSIGNDAFRGCSGLTNIAIPSGVTSIGIGAFYECYKLVEVCNRSALAMKKGSFDNGGVALYAKAVYTSDYTSKLSTDENGYIIYTDGADKILIGYTGKDTALTLPSGITEIKKYAFHDCDVIKSIIFPNSVTSIESDAFFGCRGQMSITFEDTSTWYYTKIYNNWKNKMAGTQMDVSIPADNYNNLTGNYSSYYWYKV